MKTANPRLIDLSLFSIANIFNLLAMGIFLARLWGLDVIEGIFGIIIVVMIIPVGVATMLNISLNRQEWKIVLPALFLIFLVVELMFDHILKLEFRGTPLEWPYIATFYLGMLAMIGYSFIIGSLHDNKVYFLTCKLMH